MKSGLFWDMLYVPRISYIKLFYPDVWKGNSKMTRDEIPLYQKTLTNNPKQSRGVDRENVI
jgi:hypothetical protein